MPAIPLPHLTPDRVEGETPPPRHNENEGLVHFRRAAEPEPRF